MSKLQEGGSGTSVKIVPGSNGISIDSGEQVKTVGAESTHNHDIFNRNLKAPKRYFPYSSYPARSNSEKGFSRSLQGSASIEAGVGDSISPALAKGLDKQNSCGRRVTKDSEISVFQAEKYFSAPEEKKIDAIIESRNESSNPEENSKSKRHESKNKVLFSSHDMYDSCHQIPSPAVSIPAVNCTFRPGGDTPTVSSESSWNSQSGLLSAASGNSVHKLAATDRRRPFSKWVFGCKCLCLNKNPVALDDMLTENRGASTVSNSMTSTVLMDSPLSSIKYTYAGLRRRVLGRSIEKQRSQSFVDNASEISDFNNTTNGGSGLKTPLSSPVDNIPDSGLSKDRELQKRMQGISASFMNYDIDSDQGELEERPHQTKNNGCFLEKAHDFSFPNLPGKSEESRPSLEVFGSPFPATPDRAETCNSTTVMGIHHQMQQSSDLRKSLVLFSLDKARKSFTSNSNSDTHKFTGPDNKSLEDTDQDKESDSSSDLFEIENLSAQYSFRKRDFLDDKPRIRSGYPSTNCGLRFPSSFHSGGVEDALTPSVKSCCYERSDASLDWSVTTGDTMDKASLENFSSDYEESKRHGLDLSRLRQATTKESSKMRSSTGSFLSCVSEKSVSVAVPTEYSHSTSYNYEKKGSLTPRLSK